MQKPFNPEANLTFAEKAIAFFNNLDYPAPKMDKIGVMNPYKEEEVKKVVIRFYTKYFSDTTPRHLIIGINPGRFGGGITGIPFTDPVVLQEKCGIENNFIKRQELSSKFVYAMIDALGGPAEFYSRYYISAIYPLALIKEDKNFNYYDNPALIQALKPQIFHSMVKQVQFGVKTKKIVCLGKENLLQLHKLNKELKLFEEVALLEHPRYIMQYKLKKMGEYIEKYKDILGSL